MRLVNGDFNKRFIQPFGFSCVESDSILTSRPADTPPSIRNSFKRTAGSYTKSKAARKRLYF
jgi:hypothetical protein